MEKIRIFGSVRHGEHIGIVLSKDIGLAGDETRVKEIMQRVIPVVPENTVSSPGPNLS